MASDSGFAPTLIPFRCRLPNVRHVFCGVIDLIIVRWLSLARHSLRSHRPPMRCLELARSSHWPFPGPWLNYQQNEDGVTERRCFRSLAHRGPAALPDKGLLNRNIVETVKHLRHSIISMSSPERPQMVTESAHLPLHVVIPAAVDVSRRSKRVRYSLKSISIRRQYCVRPSA